MGKSTLSAPVMTPLLHRLIGVSRLLDEVVQAVDPWPSVLSPEMPEVESSSGELIFILALHLR